MNINESSNYWESHLPFGGRRAPRAALAGSAASARWRRSPSCRPSSSRCDARFRHRRRRFGRLRARQPAERRPGDAVLVLEAGRPDSAWDLYIHMPAALAFPIGNRFYDWKYESEPEPFMNGRRIYHARGKVLGGSSWINGMIFQRGNPLDYERWATGDGLEQWDYAHCLPYFKRMETCLAGADDYRGGDGPITLERGPADGPLYDAFFDGRAAGRLRAHRRRERLPPGGLRPLRPHDPQRPPGQRGPRLLAPGAAARTSRCARARSSTGSSSRERARSASRSSSAADRRRPREAR